MSEENGEQDLTPDLVEVIENQLNDSEPKIVKETLMRLMMTGHSREEAVELIACALSYEMYMIVQHRENF